MEQEALREIWAEICFHLSDNVSPNINENIFEQKVLLTLEKFLGWSQYREEIKLKPLLQIGRQNFITPDIVLYSPDNRAVVVLEIKRPAEDLNRLEYFGQLQSYMRQTRADFGLLVGKEIHVYYEGMLSPLADPLLLSKISFKSDSVKGIEFVEIFNRESFIARKYEPHLKGHIERLEKERKIDIVREQLTSEKTKAKVIKLLQDEFSDIEKQVLMEAMKGLSINISYQQNNVTTNNERANAIISNGLQETISVCKNKSSGKHFIYIEDLKDNEVRLVNPDGGLIVLRADLFDEPKEESVDYLLSYELVTEKQLEKYNEYESQATGHLGEPIDDYPDRIEINRTRTAGRNIGQRRQTPPAYEWSRGVHELSRISGRVTWRAICDYLNVDVGVDSARRVLKDWARRNRPDWPIIPEP